MCETSKSASLIMQQIILPLANNISFSKFVFLLIKRCDNAYTCFLHICECFPSLTMKVGVFGVNRFWKYLKLPFHINYPEKKTNTKQINKCTNPVAKKK